MEISLAVNVLDPKQLREYLRYSLAAIDTVVRLTRTEYDDLAAKGLRAFIESDELWTFFINDLWPKYDNPLTRAHQVAEGIGLEFPGENAVREFIDDNWVVEGTVIARSTSEPTAQTPEAKVVEYDVPDQMVAAAERSNIDIGTLILLLPEIITLARGFLAIVKRRRG